MFLCTWNNFVMLYIIVISLLICFPGSHLGNPFHCGWMQCSGLSVIVQCHNLGWFYLLFPILFMQCSEKSTVFLVVTQTMMKTKSRHLWSAHFFTLPKSWLFFRARLQQPFAEDCSFCPALTESSISIGMYGDRLWLFSNLTLSDGLVFD